MARNDSVTRILKVIHYFETNPHGLKASDIHQKLRSDGFKVSERTVYRYFDAIQNCRLPLEQIGEGADSRWKLASVATINQKIQFSYHEMIALYLAKESLSSFKHSALFVPINNFFTRIEKALGISGIKELENLQKYIGFKPTASWQSGVSQEILDTIYHASAEGNVLQVTYKAKSGDKKDVISPRRLGPEGLYFADSGVYLIAKDLDKGVHRTYSLSRIVEAVCTDQEYISENFSMKDYVKDGIGTFNSGEIQAIEIHIQDPIASYVSERRWHDTQQITRLESGIVLKMKVRVNDELARWVLGLGPSVGKISPDSLKEMVLTLASSIVKNNTDKKAA